jgi:hypothetical protein
MRSSEHRAVERVDLSARAPAGARSLPQVNRSVSVSQQIGLIDGQDLTPFD